MDKPRWALTYMIGLVAGEIVEHHLKLSNLIYWIAVIAGPISAMLLEGFSSRRQNNRWRAW